MKRVFIILTTLIVLIGLLYFGNKLLNKIDINPFYNKQNYQKSLKETHDVYTLHCERCHGQQEQVQYHLKFGSSFNEIKKNILNGIKVVGMPSFKDSLNNEEINSLVNFIYNTREFEADNKHEYSLRSSFDTSITGAVVKLDTFYFSSQTLIPWGFEFIDSSKMLISDRENGLFYFDRQTNILKKFKNVPKAASGTFGGYLDIALHSDFESNKTIFLAYSKKYGEKIALTVLKAKVDLNKCILTEIKDIFKAEPAMLLDSEFGSRLLMDSTYLYITVGYRGKSDNTAQSLNNHLGKLIRINEDGSIPEDNPFVKKPDALPEIFAYGLRNPQGLAKNKFDGSIWSSEHGPKGGDEINLMLKGINYGWPITCYGIDYDGTIITKYTQKEGIQDPVHYWTPSIAPCGMDFLDNNLYKGWNNNLFMASLKFDYVLRMDIKNGKFVKEEQLFQGVGRVRDVKIGKDGYIYFSVEGLKDYSFRKGKPGYILRIMPVNK